MRYSYHSEQWLPHPVEIVFAFFANPRNLPRLMPPWQKAHIDEATLTPVPPRPPTNDPQVNRIAAGAESRITLSFRPFPYSPIRVRWQAEISDFAWNHHFCDTQIRGPFAFWNHCHTVTPESRTDGSGSIIEGTLLRDDVEYEMPLGKLGQLAQRLIIARQIRRTFAYRRTRTRDLLSRMPLQPTPHQAPKNQPRSAAPESAP
jgi:ligand-binding SRPBCC domain-containing protein